MIDLSSDTATRPTPEMRHFISQAEVGDEQRMEDPTVRALQEEAMEILGKEAALFLPSATQANQIAIKLHTDLGDEVIADSRSHIIESEAGAPAFISGVMMTGLNTSKGIFTSDDLEESERGSHPRFPRRRLICIENTHNMGGGTYWKLDELKSVAGYANNHRLGLHLDGARLFNAEVASGHSAKLLAEPFQTVTLCLSKGLGAPGGALLFLPKEWLEKGLRLKRILGGAMRQAGILAAGGLFGLRHHRKLLVEDHRRAKDLALFFSEQKCFDIEPSEVVTNLILLRIKKGTRWDSEKLNSCLLEKGVRILPISRSQIRVMTHLDIDDGALDEAKRALLEVIRTLS